MSTSWLGDTYHRQRVSAHDRNNAREHASARWLRRRRGFDQRLPVVRAPRRAGASTPSTGDRHLGVSLGNVDPVGLGSSVSIGRRVVVGASTSLGRAAASAAAAAAVSHRVGLAKRRFVRSDPSLHVYSSANACERPVTGYRVDASGYRCDSDRHARRDANTAQSRERRRDCRNSRSRAGSC